MMPTLWHDARLELRKQAQIEAGALAVRLHLTKTNALLAGVTRAKKQPQLTGRRHVWPN